MCMHTFAETVAIKDEGRPRERMTHVVVVGWKSRNSRADVPFPPSDCTIVFSSLATIRPCFTNSRARNIIRCQGCRWTPLREFSWQSSCCFVGSLMSIIQKIFHWEGFFMSHLLCIYGIISRTPWRIIPLLKLIDCVFSLSLSLPPFFSLLHIRVSVVTTKTKVVVRDEWHVLEYEMWQSSKANSVFLKVAKTRQYSSIFPSPACEIQRLYIEAKNSKTAWVHFSTLHEPFVWRLPDHLVSSKTTPKVNVNSREPSFENKNKLPSLLKSQRN